MTCQVVSEIQLNSVQNVVPPDYDLIEFVFSIQVDKRSILRELVCMRSSVGESVGESVPDCNEDDTLPYDD